MKNFILAMAAVLLMSIAPAIASDTTSSTSTAESGMAQCQCTTAPASAHPRLVAVRKLTTNAVHFLVLNPLHAVTAILSGAGQILDMQVTELDAIVTGNVD